MCSVAQLIAISATGGRLCFPDETRDVASGRKRARGAVACVLAEQASLASGLLLGQPSPSNSTIASMRPAGQSMVHASRRGFSVRVPELGHFLCVAIRSSVSAENGPGAPSRMRHLPAIPEGWHHLRRGLR
jgi:hypothetical protein